jgi:uncharacterized protein (TIGR02466 family)|tara:strand:+ start:557 stop:1108 length:552 start_codon:yes stop_codon:yes gene_type:complete
MKVTPFPTDFYTIHQPSNKEDLIRACKNAKKVKDQHFRWGYLSISQKERIDATEIYKELIPCIEEFCNDVGIKSIGVEVNDAWRNVYKKGYHQEPHDHTDCDLACVIFLDEYKKDQSSLYFTNLRHDCEPSAVWSKIINVHSWKMTPPRGSVIFFPSHMLHGVTPHNSKKERTTVSLNIVLKV